MVNEEIDMTANNCRSELDTISTELIATNHRLERLYDAIEMCTLDYGDLAPRIKDLRAHPEILQQKCAQIELALAERKIVLASPYCVEAYFTDMYQLLSQGTIVERRSFIKSIVKEIKITGNYILLSYIPPLPQDCCSLDGEKVLSTVQYGGR
jgi:hypothetical protein